MNPHNVGEIEDADGKGTYGSPVCGDMMQITIKVDENDTITDAKFKTFGCGSAIASSSMATDMIIGMSVEDALAVSNKKIVEELGENSYVGTAFEGCFEIAEENINNDFACSMKQRAEAAEKAVEALEVEVDNRKAVIYDLSTERDKLKAKTLTTAEAGAIKAILSHSKFEAADLADSSAQRIVELADNPDSADFRQAVQDNRQSKKRLAECDTLIQRLLETMK